MSSPTLFSPLKLGTSQLQHRIAMAPLTRFRADDNHVPRPFVAEYYAQRASGPGTLLVSEATFIAPQAGGYPNVPDPTALEQEGDYKVKSASDIPFKGGAKPEPLTEAEIKEYIGLYAQAGRNSIQAGFDGVEIHGANGYLMDQFFQDVSNQRTDFWGGSVENRARFGIEVAKAVAAAVGAENTALRLSPFSTFQGMKWPADPVPQFTYIAQELKKFNLAYLHLVESRVSGDLDNDQTEKLNFLIDIWAGSSPILLAIGFTAQSAQTAVDGEYKGKDVVIVFGRYFISNPDLPFRVKNGIELEPYDRNLFYNRKEENGYASYAFSKEFEAQQKADEASA